MKLTLSRVLLLTTGAAALVSTGANGADCGECNPALIPDDDALLACKETCTNYRGLDSGGRLLLGDSDSQAALANLNDRQLLRGDTSPNPVSDRRALLLGLPIAFPAADAGIAVPGPAVLGFTGVIGLPGHGPWAFADGDPTSSFTHFDYYGITGLLAGDRLRVGAVRYATMDTELFLWNSGVPLPGQISVANNDDRILAHAAVVTAMSVAIAGPVSGLNSLTEYAVPANGSFLAGVGRFNNRMVNGPYRIYCQIVRGGLQLPCGGPGGDSLE